MGKMGKQTIDELRTAADAAADDNGMCTCRALIDNVRDNGNRYAAGDALHMHKALVPAHVQTGQVELISAEPKSAGTKQTTTPRNKQTTTGKDK